MKYSTSPNVIVNIDRLQMTVSCWCRDTLSIAKVKYRVGLDVVWLKGQVGRFKHVLPSACAEDASKLKANSTGLTLDIRFTKTNSNISAASSHEVCDSGICDSEAVLEFRQ